MERRNGNFRLKLQRKHDLKDPSSCKILKDTPDGVRKNIAECYLICS